MREVVSVEFVQRVAKDRGTTTVEAMCSTLWADQYWHEHPLPDPDGREQRINDMIDLILSIEHLHYRGLESLLEVFW